jgi:hypothetical protein
MTKSGASVVFTALFVLASTPPLIAQGPCRFAASFPDTLLELHKKDWSGVSLNAVESVIGLRLIPEDGASSNNCVGSIFAVAEGASSACRFTAEFERNSAPGHGCFWALSRVSILVVTPMRVAEPLRARVLTLLRPGGRSYGEGADVEFQWRATDSRQRYDLFASVTALAEPATPSTSAKIKVILAHDAVEPTDVDHLPFEKGYFPPTCPRAQAH